MSETEELRLREGWRDGWKEGVAEGEGSGWQQGVTSRRTVRISRANGPDCGANLSLIGTNVEYAV